MNTWDVGLHLSSCLDLVNVGGSHVQDTQRALKRVWLTLEDQQKFSSGEDALLDQGWLGAHQAEEEGQSESRNSTCEVEWSCAVTRSLLGMAGHEVVWGWGNDSLHMGLEVRLGQTHSKLVYISLSICHPPLLFIQKYLSEDSVYARHQARCWMYNHKQGPTFAPQEFVWRESSRGGVM